MVHLERLALAAVLLTFAFGGYFWIGLSVDPAEAASLATPLDAHIPFVPAMLPVYAVVYLMILLPIFLVESPALFRRIVVAYLVMVAICLLCCVSAAATWFIFAPQKKVDGKGVKGPAHEPVSKPAEKPVKSFEELLRASRIARSKSGSGEPPKT